MLPEEARSRSHPHLRRVERAGRHVRKGEKAITLCMPGHRQAADRCQETSTHPHPRRRRRRAASHRPPAASSRRKGSPYPDDLVYKPHWFLLSRLREWSTRPRNCPIGRRTGPSPRWRSSRSASPPNGKLPGVRPRPRRLGFAGRRDAPQDALPRARPCPARPHRRREHARRPRRDPRNLREVEAECVALICCESLNLAARRSVEGYVQSWFSGATIPERSAQKNLQAADQLLKSGRPAFWSQRLRSRLNDRGCFRRSDCDTDSYCLERRLSMSTTTVAPTRTAPSTASAIGV